MRLLSWRAAALALVVVAPAFAVTSAGCGSDPSVPPPAADASADTIADMGADMGADAGVDTTVDTSADIRADTRPPMPDAEAGGPHPDGEAGTPSDSGTDTGSGSDTGTDTGSGSDADSGTTLPTPIRYVFVVVKENHTFDNYFATFPGADGTLQATLSNGTVVSLMPAPDVLPSDLGHGHGTALTAWNNGGMNGFDLANPVMLPGGGFETFTYYTQAQIPNYWAYAQSFVLCDEFFTTVLGPSFPGHLSPVAAQSPGYNNPAGNWGCNTAYGVGTVETYTPGSCQIGTTSPSCFAIPSVVDALPAPLTWRAYGNVLTSGELAVPFEAIQSIGSAGGTLPAHFRNVTSLLSDLGAGDMANVTYVDTYPPGLSEHPPSNPCPGENYTVQIVNAIMQGPHWNESAIVVTWDDWGGFYDHVAPTIDTCTSGGPFNTGFRVPALIISPYARTAILHTPTEQASIPKLIEDLFGMPRMNLRDPNARDARAGSLLPAFDFTQAPRAPLILTPRATCP